MQSTRLANALGPAGVPFAYTSVVGGGHGTNFPPSVQHATVRHFMHTLRHAPGDLNNNGAVNVEDLLVIIGGWGPCPAAPAFCASEASGDQTVNVTDLLLVIENWG